MNKSFGIRELAASLPRRCPTLLLDRAEIIDDTHLVALKQVTANEEFFIGHFPGHPIMPGVLQVEAMKQLCELIARPALATAEMQDIHLPLIEKVKFRRPVTPGDRMKIEAELLETGDNRMRFKTVCSTKGGVTSEAFLTLAARPLIAPAGMPELFNDLDRTDSVPMDNLQTMSMMPHRYPFLFIDYIANIDDTTVTAVKNISVNDNFFRQIGTDSPMMPESLLCEISAQAGAACVLSRPENKGKLGFFMAIDRAESFAPIVPGDQLCAKVTLPAGKSKFGKGPCEITVNGEKRFSISLMFAIVDA